MSFENQVLAQRQESLLATNTVLRNTYLLLSLTLLFGGACAGIAMLFRAPAIHPILMLVGFFGLQFLTIKLRDSVWGLPSVFAFTGFLGYTVGPILNLYLSTYVNGGQLILTALGGTGVIFLALSAYALTTRKDFSYLGGFLFAGFLVAFIMGIAGMIFHMPMLQLLISGAFALLSSGLILYQTSEIIHGGERNYIMATMSLYIALFNLFLSLLRILGVFSNRE